jgi:hypothetical protein
VIVAVIAVLMVQPPVDEIVDVVAVRHRFMPAAGAVDMPRFVIGAAVLGIATVWVSIGNLDHVLVDMIAMRMVKVPIVQVVDVVTVLDGDVAASGAMFMRVVGMRGVRARCHRWPP